MKAAEATRLRVAESIIDLVGETPMLKLRRVVPTGAADVYAKLEYLNPGGSVKDRAAIGIIRRAERDGLLHPGSTLVESTGGRTDHVQHLFVGTQRTKKHFCVYS